MRRRGFLKAMVTAAIVPFVGFKRATGSAGKFRPSWIPGLRGLKTMQTGFRILPDAYYREAETWTWTNFANAPIGNQEESSAVAKWRYLTSKDI